MFCNYVYISNHAVHSSRRVCICYVSHVIVLLVLCSCVYVDITWWYIAVVLIRNDYDDKHIS